MAFTYRLLKENGTSDIGVTLQNDDGLLDRHC